MPSLTDGEIRRTLKQVEQTGKQLNLVDGKGHGTGRLVLVMKPMPTRVTADWMAQQWRDQKRDIRGKPDGSPQIIGLRESRKVQKEIRTNDAPEAFSCAGPRGAYIYFAMTLDPSIVDAYATNLSGLFFANIARLVPVDVT